jgi:hypothetical protein
LGILCIFVLLVSFLLCLVNKEGRKEGRQVVVKSEKELGSSSCIFVVPKGMLELSSGRHRDGDDDDDDNDEPTFYDLSWVLLLVP